MAEIAYASPQPSGLNRAQIAAAAKSLAEVVNHSSGDDPLDAVAKLGGEIVYQDLWQLESSDSGSITIRSPSDFTIFLATHTSKERDRFTVAHELGHFLLHYYYCNKKSKKPVSEWAPMKAERYGDGLTEQEVNWFAASFLMPVADFKAAHNDSGGKITRLAQRFGVSAAAARVRAKSLGLAVEG